MTRNPNRELKRYQQLLRIQIGENRFIVVSRTPNEKISIAQQIRIQEKDGGVFYVFIKNAFIFQKDEIFEEFRKELQTIKLNPINEKQRKINF